MESNIHTPERLQAESMEAYRIRRHDSKFATQKVIGLGLGGGVSSRQSLRDAMRKNGTMGKRIRAYAALMDHFAAQRKLGNIKHALV